MIELLIDDNVDYHVHHDDGYVNDSDDDDNDDDNHIKCFSKFKGSRSVLIPYTFIYILTCQISFLEHSTIEYPLSSVISDDNLSILIF